MGKTGLFFIFFLFVSCKGTDKSAAHMIENVFKVENHEESGTFMFIIPALTDTGSGQIVKNRKIVFQGGDSPFGFVAGLLNGEKNGIFAGKFLFKGHKIRFELFKPLLPSRLLKFKSRFFFLSPGKGYSMGSGYDVFYPKTRSLKIRSGIFDVNKGLKIFLPPENGKPGFELFFKTRKINGGEIGFTSSDGIDLLKSQGNILKIKKFSLKEGEYVSFIAGNGFERRFCFFHIVKSAEKQVQYYFLMTRKTPVLFEPDFYGFKRGFLSPEMFVFQLLSSLRSRLSMLNLHKNKYNIIYLPEFYFLKKTLRSLTEPKEFLKYRQLLSDEIKKFITFKTVKSEDCLIFAGTGDTVPLKFRFDLENYLGLSDISVVSHEGEAIIYNVTAENKPLIFKKIRKIMKNHGFLSKDFQISDRHSFLILKLPPGTGCGRCPEGKYFCKVFGTEELSYSGDKKRWLGFYGNCENNLLLNELGF